MSEPRTHDYTVRGWGHDFYIHSAGEPLKVSGWGSGIQTGDFLILPNGDAETRYQVSEIEYMRDPADMWRAELTFAPREQAVRS